MSSHFNYEIEERNMRNQLKKLEVSFKEEAWVNYEGYAKQFQSTHKTQLIPNFNFALNRTVILPVVFGSIIVLFSFLLFNFINIKNTKTKSEVSQLKPAVIDEPLQPQPKKAVVVPVKKEESVKETAAIVTATTAVITNTVATVAAKTTPTVQTNVPVNTIATTAVSKDTQLTKTVPTYTFEPKKRRRKKSNAEVLESIATPVSLPTVTQEEAEPELR